jgi:hypothetical protein
VVTKYRTDLSILTVVSLELSHELHKLRESLHGTASDVNAVRADLVFVDLKG